MTVTSGGLRDLVLASAGVRVANPIYSVQNRPDYSHPTSLDSFPSLPLDCGYLRPRLYGSLLRKPQKVASPLIVIPLHLFRGECPEGHHSVVCPYVLSHVPEDQLSLSLCSVGHIPYAKSLGPVWVLPVYRTPMSFLCLGTTL